MRPQATRPTQLRRNLRPLPAPPLSVAVQRELRGITPQAGYSLIELLLVAGVIAAGSAIVLAVYQNVNAASKTNTESSNLSELTQKITSSYASGASYNGLTTESALSESLFPRSMTASGSNEGVSSWGTPVRVLATAVNINGTDRPNGGFVIAYDRLPAKACVDLVSEAAANFGDIKIQGTSVGVGQSLNVGQVGELCNRAQGADVQFIYKPATTSNVPDGGLGACAAGLPTGPQTRTVACPAGQYGVVSQSRSAFCASYYGSYDWTPWTTVSQSCATCPAPETRVATQSLSCPTGQLGTWTQKRNEQRVADCPKPGPNGPSETYTWGSWTGTGAWENTANTCAPICVLPTPANESRWTPQTAACPTGQSGHNTWERQEVRAATCPAPTGAFVWSGWTANGTVRNQSNTCATCPAPQNQTLTCPTGQVGSIQQNRTFACSGEGSWNAWTTTSNTCTTCPAPQSQTLSCPAGQVGIVQQNRSFSCTGETGSWGAWTTTTNTCSTCPAPQSQTLGCPAGQVGQIQQARTYNCSGSTGSWGGWTTTSNTCSTCPAPQTETQSLACPSFQTGSITQQRSRSFTCSGAGSWSGWSGWATTSNTCAVAACDGTLAGNARSYMSRYPDLAAAFYGGWGQDYNQAYSHWKYNGYFEGRQSCWSAPCPDPVTEYNYNDYSYRSTGCPAGQTGVQQWYAQQVQSRTRYYDCPVNTTVIPPPSYTGWSGWSDTGYTHSYSSTCTPTCVAGPAYWQYEMYHNCPAGRLAAYGERRRLVTPVCPSGSVVGNWEVYIAPRCCSRACQIE